MRRCCALIAGLLAGRVTCAPSVRAEDVRDTFGLGRRPQEPLASCGDGLAFNCAIATDPLDDATPYALSTWLAGSYLARLPIGDATHDQLAAYALGASHDEAGPVFGGASGLENRWTIDGAPADNLRTGAADTRIPVAFLEGILVSAGGFSARDRASTGGTIDARLRRGTPHHELSADVWTHLTLASREPPHATGSYDVRRLTTVAGDTGPGVSASLVATGPIPGLGALGGTAWYAAGIAPGLTATDRTWRAARLADANTDGIPDGLPGEVAVIPVEASRARTLDYLVPAMARVGLDRDAQHLELSLIGHAARDSRFLGNATLPAAGIDRTTLVGDAIATWRGSWAQTHARVQLSWHHSARRDSAHDPAAAHLPQLLTAFVPQTLADDPQLAAVCDDTSPDDPTRLIANCPVPSGLFASGGAGLLTRAIGDRPTATADIAHQVGGHVLRAGATFEDTRLVTTSSFTGDQEQFALFPGELSRRRFYVGDCTDEPATAPCDYASRSQLTYRTVYAAAFAEDTFAPQRGLSIDGGLRWELMWVGTRLRFSHELAPRVGIAWDVLGDGRSRVWANLGKTFAMLPAGLGPTVIQRDAIADDFELGGLVSRRHDTGAAVQVVPGTEPIEQDEITFGGELALVGALRATVWGQGRFIRRGLETTPGGFDNPGRNGDVPATRQSELIAFALEMMQRERTSIRAGVSWGRVDGTWTGPYDPRQGANLLAGSDWDVDASNLFGPLPTSPGSRVFVEAERRGRLGAVDAWVATRLEAGSGRPRNALADGPEGVVELLPRGALGNGPVLAQTDLRLAARWRGFTATLELVNVFDRREPTNLDEIYTGDAVRPIEGGSYADLVFLKTDAGTPASRRTAFQLPTAFQDPMQITLGVHRTF